MKKQKSTLEVALEETLDDTLEDTLADALADTLEATLEDTLDETLEDTLEETLEDTIEDTLEETKRIRRHKEISVKRRLDEALTDQVSYLLQINNWQQSIHIDPLWQAKVIKYHHC